MQLPLFPEKTKMINSYIGIFEKQDMVYYLHNGQPIYCHNKGDMNNYRYITAQLIVNGLCRPCELSKALGIGKRNFERYARSLRDKGSDWFFNRVENRGKCYKLNDESFRIAEDKLAAGHSVAAVARELGVSEGALRYQIKKGRIKKEVPKKTLNP